MDKVKKAISTHCNILSSVSLREVSKNKVLRKIFGPKKFASK
jgi:hypothetical protein